MDQPIAIALASTVRFSDGAVIDTLQTVEDLRTWLRLHAERLPSPRLRAGGGRLDELRSLRDATRRLFTAAVAEDSAEVGDVHLVNRLSQSVPNYLQLVWPKGGSPKAMPPPPDDRSVVPLATLAADVVKVITGAYGDLRGCEGPSCVLFFVRTHPRQEWCSAACGNRARVARHYRRIKSSP